MMPSKLVCGLTDGNRIVAIARCLGVRQKWTQLRRCARIQNFWAPLNTSGSLLMKSTIKKIFWRAVGFCLKNPLFISRGVKEQFMRVRTNQPGQNTSVMHFYPRSTKSKTTALRRDARASGPTISTVCEVAKILQLGKLSVYQGIGRGDPVRPHRQVYPHPQSGGRLHVTLQLRAMNPIVAVDAPRVPTRNAACR